MDTGKDVFCDLMRYMHMALVVVFAYMTPGTMGESSCVACAVWLTKILTTWSSRL